MMWLTLQQIKAQCRIEPDFTLEDELLTSYGEAAEETILELCNRSYVNLIDSYGKVPTAIVQASLLLVDSSYANRSPSSVQSLSLVPYGFDRLVKQYIKLEGSKDGDEAEYETVTLGSDTKIAFAADLPDGLKMEDVDFTGDVINADKKDVKVAFTKSDCIKTDEGATYVVLINSDDLGVGTLMLRLVVMIPDTDYPTGFRKEVIKINPHVKITG